MKEMRLYRVWHGTRDGWLIMAHSVDEALRLAREVFPDANQAQPVARDGEEFDSLRDLTDRKAAIAAIVRDRIPPDAPARVCRWWIRRHGETAYIRLPEYQMWWEV